MVSLSRITLGRKTSVGKSGDRDQLRKQSEKQAKKPQGVHQKVPRECPPTRGEAQSRNGRSGTQDWSGQTNTCACGRWVGEGWDGRGQSAWTHRFLCSQLGKGSHPCTWVSQCNWKRPNRPLTRPKQHKMLHSWTVGVTAATPLSFPWE